MDLSSNKFCSFARYISHFAAALCLAAVLNVSSNGQEPTPTPTPLPTPVIDIEPPSDDVILPPVPQSADPMPVAPDVRPEPRPLPSTERVGVDAAANLSLTIADAVRMALENNNDIDTSRNDVQIAEFNFRGARGIYDPVFGAEGYYESRTTPTASTIGGATNGSVTLKQFFGNAGVTGFSPVYGGQYSAGFTSSRTNTSNLNATLNPQYPTDLTFRYTQPLFRGLRFDANRRNIEIAKKNLSLSDSQFRQQAIETIAAVERTYWDLVYAMRNLQVQTEALRHARTLLESNQRQVDQGVLAPIDVVAATAQITTLEQNVYLAQETVSRSENTLKTMLLPDRSNPMWSRPITPVSPVNLDAPRVGLEVAVADALKNRPEIEQLATSLDINKIDERYFRDQTKPQIDLVGQYTAAGLSGTATPPRTTTPSALTTRVNELSILAGLPEMPAGSTVSTVPPNLIGGYFTSLGNLAAQDYPTYRVGVTVSLPWGNTTAKANLGRTLVQADRITNIREQTEQIIEAEVRNALQALRSAEARLASAVAARDAAEQLAESEERLFRAGTTTFYLVLERQTQLLTARGRELQAQTDLNKAISEFQRATGRTLEANNVDISQE